MENSDEAVELIRIHPRDNIAVVPRSVEAGGAVSFEGRIHPTETAVVLGHKFAVELIARGEKVRKYGVPIGSATADIPAGSLVHLHNLRSDYLPTYTLDGKERYDR